MVVAYLFTCDGNATVEDMYERVEPEDYLRETLKEPNPQITASDMCAFVKENILQLGCGNLAGEIGGQNDPGFQKSNANRALILLRFLTVQKGICQKSF